MIEPEKITQRVRHKISVSVKSMCRTIRNIVQYRAAAADNLFRSTTSVPVYRMSSNVECQHAGNTRVHAGIGVNTRQNIMILTVYICQHEFRNT
jgi:hypothetical protein